AAYVGRGWALFSKADFPLAASDLQRSLELEADAYAILVRFLARARSGVSATAELEQNAKYLETRQWPDAVVELYLGQRSVQETLTAATKPEEKCEAHFYFGQLAILRGHRTEAERELKLASDNCPKNFNEYIAAQADLRRLGAISH